MKLKTRRNYKVGGRSRRDTASTAWYQDYEYELPFPLGGGVNVFVAEGTSSDNAPSQVPSNFKVQVVSESTSEQTIQPVLTETGPTEVEALFTTWFGSEYKLKLNDYQRFAGFNDDGSTKAAGTGSFDGLIGSF